MLSSNFNGNRYCNFRVATCLRIVIVLIIGAALAACGNNDQEVSNNIAPQMAMPVSFISVEPRNVPISAEAVAQTEGAKEIEIRPRVGGILLKRLYQEGAAVEAGQPMFLIDPVPYQNALAQAQAQLIEQQARVEQTIRE